MRGLNIHSWRASANGGASSAILSDMGTGLFVSVKRGSAFATAEIESVSEEELQDVLRRASPSQMRTYCT
jgi:hypothetical protein